MRGVGRSPPGVHFEVLEAPLTMPGRWATAGGCPERAWQRERGREATGLAGSGEGVTSAEGHAAAARSRAREGNENQLKAGLLFRGQKGDFQWQKLGKVFFFFLLARSAPRHTGPLSPGVVGLGRASGEKGSPWGTVGVHCASSCLVLLLWLSCSRHSSCPSADVERGEVSAGCGPALCLSTRGTCVLTGHKNSVRLVPGATRRLRHREVT